VKSLSKSRRHLGLFWSLSLSEKGLLISAFAVLALSKVLLLLFPFSQFIKPRKRITQKALSEEFIAKRVWAVRIVSARMPLGFTCLVQAISTKWLLHNHPDLRVHIGVRTDKEAGFTAHAWLTYQNRTLIGNQVDQVFEPILAWN
jgi:hypothetical protein